MGRDWRYGDRLVPEEVCVAVIVARGRCLLSPVNVARGKKIPQRQDGISQGRAILSRQLWLKVRKKLATFLSLTLFLFPGLVLA